MLRSDGDCVGWRQIIGVVCVCCEPFCCGFVECEAQWTQRVGHIEKEKEKNEMVCV